MSVKLCLQGDIVWKISEFGGLFDAFKSANCGEQFYSDPFTLFGAVWQIQCFPNGEDRKHEGNVGIHLVCIQLPESRKTLKVSYCFKANSICISSDQSAEFVENSWWGLPGTISTNSLKSMQHLVIGCVIKSNLENDHNVAPMKRNWKQAKISQLIKENHSLKRQLLTVTTKSTELQSLRNKIREQHDALIESAKQIKNLRCHQNKVYSVSPVLKMEEIDIAEHDDINKEIDFNKYQQIFAHHQHIMDEWNINTQKLNLIMDGIARSNNIDTNCINGTMDEDYDQITQKNGLYEAYIECNKLMDVQSRRLHQIESDSHIPQLLQNQNNLSKEKRANSKATELGIEQKNILHAEYTNTKNKRVALINIIESKVKECNEMIAAENELLIKLKDETNLINLLDDQSKKLQSASNSCISLIDSYKDFEENNTKFIDGIKKCFNRKWSEFEEKWWTWSIIDILAWFWYKTLERNTTMINWRNIENEMKKRNINGQSLQYFNDSRLNLIGIHDFNIAVYLMKQITILRNKYKMYNDSESDDMDNRNNDDNDTDIPSKYICPLTRQIMDDPVIAFDNNTYERAAIEEYLKTHKKSPKTKDDAYTFNLFPCKQLKKEIKYYRVLHDNHETDEGVTDPTEHH